MSAFRTLSLRTRLIAALAIPLVVLTVLAGLRVASSARFSNDAQQQLDEVDNVVLASELAVIVRNERDVTLRFGATDVDLARFRARTDFALDTVVEQGAANGLNAETIAVVESVRTDLEAIRLTIGDDPQLLADGIAADAEAGRRFADEGSTYGALIALDELTNRVLSLVDLDSETLIDPATAQDLSSLRLADQLDARVSFEAANYVLLALVPASAVTDEVVALQVRNRSQAELLQSELATLGDGQTKVQLADLFASPAWSDFESLRSRVSQVGPGESVAFNNSVANDAIAEIGSRLEDIQIESINTLFASAYNSRAEANRSAVITVAWSLALLALVSAIVFWLYRSIRSPISNLTDRSREIAEVELPQVVELMRAGGVSEEIPEIEPIEAETSDEIGELVEAFNGMHQTAVTLAAEQAGSRRTVGDMFVNLGRRNQKLLIRMLGELDALEVEEKDPDRLASLYRVDRLATRMRRNAESLLVLAGASAARRVDQPVPLSEIARSGVSEVEQFDRVDISVSDDVLVDGSIAVDAAHLLAELTENALQFSPNDRRVAVRLLRARTGFRVVIIDEGLGMKPDKLEAANTRIQEAANNEESPSKQLGLFVVGRLAGRHGLDVRLDEGIVSGLTAIVEFPDSVTVGESSDADGNNEPQVVATPRQELGAASPTTSGVQTPERHLAVAPAPSAMPADAPTPEPVASAPMPSPEPAASALTGEASTTADAPDSPFKVRRRPSRRKDDDVPANAPVIDTTLGAAPLTSMPTPVDPTAQRVASPSPVMQQPPSLQSPSPQSPAPQPAPAPASPAVHVPGEPLPTGATTPQPSPTPVTPTPATPTPAAPTPTAPAPPAPASSPFGATRRPGANLPSAVKRSTDVGAAPMPAGNDPVAVTPAARQRSAASLGGFQSGVRRAKEAQPKRRTTDQQEPSS